MSKESWRELYEKLQTPLEKLQFLNGLSELSWDDCQDAWFESNKLMPQIAAQLSAAEKERDSLKSKLAVAVTALEELCAGLYYTSRSTCIRICERALKAINEGES